MAYFAMSASTLGWMKLRYDFGHTPPMSSATRRIRTAHRSEDGGSETWAVPEFSPMNIFRNARSMYTAPMTTPHRPQMTAI